MTSLPEGWTSHPAPGRLVSRRLRHRCGWVSPFLYSPIDHRFIRVTVDAHTCEE